MTIIILTKIRKTRGCQLEEDEFGIILNLLKGDTREKMCSNQLKIFIWGSEEMLGLSGDVRELSA